jgi:hypothetical protein
MNGLPPPQFPSPWLVGMHVLLSGSVATWPSAHHSSPVEVFFEAARMIQECLEADSRENPGVKALDQLNVVLRGLSLT